MGRLSKRASKADDLQTCHVHSLLLNGAAGKRGNLNKAQAAAPTSQADNIGATLAC